LGGLSAAEFNYANVQGESEFNRYEAEFLLCGRARLNNFVSGEKIIDFVQYGTSEELNEGGRGYPTLRLNEIDGCFIQEPVKHCDRIKPDEFNALRLRSGDVLICRTNGNPRLVGKASIVMEDTEVAYASYLFRLRPNGLISPATLVTYLNATSGRKEIERFTLLGNQANFSPAKFREIRIPVFSKQLIQRIDELLAAAYYAHKLALSFYSDAMEQLLDVLRLQNWQPSNSNSAIKKFSDSFSANGRLDAEYYQPKYDAWAERIKQHPAGFAELVMACQIKEENFSPDEAQTYLYIELADIGSHGNVMGATKDVGAALPTRARRRVSVGDVVVSSIEGSLQSVALVTADYDNALCSTGFYVVRSDTINPETLLVLFKSEAYQDLFKQACTGTILTAMPREFFGCIPVPVIDSAVQQIIAEKIQASFAARRHSQQHIELAKQTVERAIESNETEALEWLQEQLVLLEVSELGNHEIAQGKAKPIAGVVQRLRIK